MPYLFAAFDSEAPITFRTIGPYLLERAAEIGIHSDDGLPIGVEVPVSESGENAGGDLGDVNKVGHRSIPVNEKAK